MSLTPFDSKKLGEEAIIDFSKIRKKAADVSNKQEQEPIKDKQTSVSKEEMQMKVATARKHANKEIEEYRKVVHQFKTDIEKLALFKNVGESMESICLSILDNVLEPILKGTKPYGMPDEMYREIRKDMYKLLIYKYIDNQEDNE